MSLYIRAMRTFAENHDTKTKITTNISDMTKPVYQAPEVRVYVFTTDVTFCLSGTTGSIDGFTPEDEDIDLNY